MGKDKKENKGLVADLASFQTKEALKDRNVELTTQVLDLDRRYKEVYTAVHNLESTYLTCKERFAVQRYGDLKDMIKTCVSDEVMQKAARYAAKTEPEEKGKAVSLMKAARQLSSGTNDLETVARQEVSGLHKAEIIRDIEEKEKRKEKMEIKFLRLHNRLQKLKRDYEESKQHIPTKRYMVMKEIIKPLIRDDALKVDM